MAVRTVGLGQLGWGLQSLPVASAWVSAALRACCGGGAWLPLHAAQRQGIRVTLQDLGHAGRDSETRGSPIARDPGSHVILCYRSLVMFIEASHYYTICHLSVHIFLLSLMAYHASYLILIAGSILFPTIHSAQCSI